jgi:glycosyltransferase involved in cell wall biosynthesis
LAPYQDDSVISLPNKPFEYMAAGLPLLSSLPGELEQLITEHQIGLHYRAGDVQSLVEKIIWFTEHPEERMAMGRRARRLFEERFRADVIYPKLVTHLEQVVAKATLSNFVKSLI